MNYPTSFQSETKPLEFKNLGEAAAAAGARLAAKGYIVHQGLTEELASQITAMSQEPAILEYCPNDFGGRFTSPSATEQWLSKGRATFLLFKKSNDQSRSQLVGYGWAGAGKNKYVPDGETTFAIRIGEAAQGQGLATDFARLIVLSAASVYNASNFWLEAWQSNSGAIHVYHKLGFTDVTNVEESRRTTKGGATPDARLYMSLDNRLLPSDEGSSFIKRFPILGRFF